MHQTSMWQITFACLRANMCPNILHNIFCDKFLLISIFYFKESCISYWLRLVLLIAAPCYPVCVVGGPVTPGAAGGGETGPAAMSPHRGYSMCSSWSHYGSPEPHLSYWSPNAILLLNCYNVWWQNIKTMVLRQLLWNHLISWAQNFVVEDDKHVRWHSISRISNYTQYN